MPRVMYVCKCVWMCLRAMCVEVYVMYVLKCVCGCFICVDVDDSK